MELTQHDTSRLRRGSRRLGAIRLAEAAAALLLLGIASVTIVGHVTQAMTGTSLVFSQDQMGEPGGQLGPAPMQGEPSPEPLPPAATVGGAQYVDVVGIGLTLAGGLTAAAGAFLLGRRSRWSVPLGMAGMAVVGAIGAFPALLGIWAASFYGMTSPGQLVPYLGISAVAVGLALAGLVTIWRDRAAIGSG